MKLFGSSNSILSRILGAIIAILGSLGVASPHIDLGSSSTTSSDTVKVIEASENLVDEKPVE